VCAYVYTHVRMCACVCVSACFNACMDKQPCTHLCVFSYVRALVRVHVDACV